jgi:hypothetical protein
MDRRTIGLDSLDRISHPPSDEVAVTPIQPTPVPGEDGEDIARVLPGDRDAGEDLAQDVFLRLIRASIGRPDYLHEPAWRFSRRTRNTGCVVAAEGRGRGRDSAEHWCSGSSRAGLGALPMLGGVPGQAVRCADAVR